MPLLLLMKEIRFITDYRGVLTSEQYYKAGAVIEHENAHVLVTDGRAEWYGKSASGYHDMTLNQLKLAAKNASIKGYGRMKREKLIERLENA